MILCKCVFVLTGPHTQLCKNWNLFFSIPKHLMYAYNTESKPQCVFGSQMKFHKINVKLTILFRKIPILLHKFSLVWSSRTQLRERRIFLSNYFVLEKKNLPRAMFNTPYNFMNHIWYICSIIIPDDSYINKIWQTNQIWIRYQSYMT